MILELHLCGPKGDGHRQELDRALELLQLDNEFLIQAMLRDGRHVPDLVDDMNLRYRPPTPFEAKTDRERFLGLREMMRRREFSCQDAAGWEAAVLSQKYRMPATAYHEPVSAAGFYHAVYWTPQGVIDPVARYLAKRGTNGYLSGGVFA